jgi:hypothetical protein
MKTSLILSDKAYEVLSFTAKKNRRSLSNELSIILESLEYECNFKESETVQKYQQPIKKSGSCFFTPGEIYFNDQKEECTYIKSYDINMGIFKNHEYDNECTYEYIDMYIDSACIKKVIQ